VIASGSFDASLSSSGQGGIVNIVAKHSPHKLRRGLLMSLRSKCADVRLVVAADNLISTKCLVVLYIMSLSFQ
jgi:hypothetical protein